ncbi:hypothetical protein P8452_07839 [Trifolium repens]|nr:hypothetical protein P8452_07839 [Trifolium repens]
MRFLSYSTIISGLRLTNGATTSKLNHFLTAPWFEEDRERACYRSERNRAKKEAEECRQKLTDLLNYAKSIARLTPNLEKEFLEMPTTIEELEAAIQDTTSQANSILFVYRNILEQYEDRQRQIEDLATKLDADKKESRRLLAELDNVKVRLPVRLAWYHLC